MLLTITTPSKVHISLKIRRFVWEHQCSGGNWSGFATTSHRSGSARGKIGVKNNSNAFKDQKTKFWNLELLLRNNTASKRLAQLINSSEGLRESLWPIETATYKWQVPILCLGEQQNTFLNTSDYFDITNLSIWKRVSHNSKSEFNHTLHIWAHPIVQGSSWPVDHLL